MISGLNGAFSFALMNSPARDKPSLVRMRTFAISESW